MTATPLSALLSQIVVAFTIEFDNAFEQRLRETFARPFLTSLAMWSNVMRYLPAEGTTLQEMASQSRLPEREIKSLVGAHERWRYLNVDRGTKAEADFGTARGLTPDTRLEPNLSGEVAREIRSPLGPEIEQRWTERFEGASVEALKRSLAGVLAASKVGMPRFLPVLTTKGLFSAPAVELADGESDDSQELATLLSRVLLAFALDYEADSKISLPIASNVLRVLTDKATGVNDLPLAAGVSKEAASMSLTWLEKQGLVEIRPHPSGKGKVASLTPEGVDAHGSHAERLAQVERIWTERFGADLITLVRHSAEALLGHAAFAQGLQTPEGGWRGTGRYKSLTAAFIDRPKEALPQYPMVLHRGGWPDGS